MTNERTKFICEYVEARGGLDLLQREEKEALHEMNSAHLIQSPNGKWGFVGNVPVSLGFAMKDGSPLSDEMAKNIAHVGPGIYSKKIKTLSWKSAQDAIKAAKKDGKIKTVMVANKPIKL